MFDRNKMKVFFIVCFSLWIAIFIGERIFPSEYAEAAKEPVSVESQQVQQELTESPVTPSSIVAQAEKISRGGEIDRDKVTRAINEHLNGLLANKGQTYVEAGKLEGVNPMLMAAISIHETRVEQNGKQICTSDVLRNANNVAGINWNEKSVYPKYGRYNKYPTIEKSIYNMAEKLNYYYISEGRKDIASIGEKWAPMDDYQQGMYGMDNGIWAREVTEIYLKILNDAEGQ